MALKWLFSLKWLLVGTFLLGGEESSALDTEENISSPKHNIKSILLNFPVIQLFFQICWKREQKLGASKPTKTRMFKNKRKRTKDILKPLKNGILLSYDKNKMISAEFVLICEKKIKHTTRKTRLPTKKVLPRSFCVCLFLFSPVILLVR